MFSFFQQWYWFYYIDCGYHLIFKIISCLFVLSIVEKRMSEYVDTCEKSNNNIFCFIETQNIWSIKDNSIFFFLLPSFFFHFGEGKFDKNYDFFISHRHHLSICLLEGKVFFFALSSMRPYDFWLKKKNQKQFILCMNVFVYVCVYVCPVFPKFHSVLFGRFKSHWMESIFFPIWNMESMKEMGNRNFKSFGIFEKSFLENGWFFFLQIL